MIIYNLNLDGSYAGSYQEISDEFTGEILGATTPPPVSGEVHYFNLSTNSWQPFSPYVLEPKAPPVPDQITRAQAIGALILAGLDELVQPAIAAIEDPVQRKLAQNDWTNRLNFERRNPTLLALSATLGLTESDLDDLFRVAASL